MIVIAEEIESQLAERFYPGEDVMVVGVGINVLKALADIPRTEHLHNVGYAGGWNLPVGTVVSVNKCRSYHPKIDYPDDFFCLQSKDSLQQVCCYTSLDFVTSYSGDEPCVFDMELALICAMGFIVDSIKVVSDNLDYKEYEHNTKQDRLI